jgi:hypothetical protein
LQNPLFEVTGHVEVENPLKGLALKN